MTGELINAQPSPELVRYGMSARSAVWLAGRA